jgi:hypothetical protein
MAELTRTMPDGLLCRVYGLAPLRFSWLSSRSLAELSQAAAFIHQVCGLHVDSRWNGDL